MLMSTALMILLTTCCAVTAGQTELSNCRVDIDTDWTVRSSCNYTKANVSRIGDINCTWYRQDNLGSVILVTEGIVMGQGITEGGKTYYSGNCSFSVNVSKSQTGNHTFYIDFMPGPGRVETGHITIEEPGKPESTCQGRIVFPEGQDRSCDCTNNKSQPGSPPPTVRWRGSEPAKPLWLRDMPRCPIESTWTCEMIWGPEGNSIVKTTTFTTVIVYGPDLVKILDNRHGSPLTNATDLYVGQAVTWRCTVNTASVTSRFEWTGVTCDSNKQKDECPFTARRQFDGGSITCTARNPDFGDVLNARASVQLNVKYPPTVPPEITGYINNTELTEGDNLTSTCTVRGGNPPVSSVTFSCGTDHHDNPNDTVVNSALHNDSYVSSTVMIERLQAGDDGTMCVCGAHWQYGPVTLNYTLTSSVTLNVNAAVTTTIATTTRPQQQTSNNRDPKDSPLPIAAIAGGAAGGFVVIVLIVVIVCVTTRKRRPQENRSHVPTTEEDDFEEHENPIYGTEDDTAPIAQLTSRPSVVALRIPSHSDNIANQPSTHSNVYHTISGNEEYTTVGSTKLHWVPAAHTDASVTKVSSAAVGSGVSCAGQQQQTLPHADNFLTTGSKSSAATEVSGTSDTTSSPNTASPSSSGSQAEAGTGMFAAQKEEKSSNANDGLYCNTTEGDLSDTNPYENTAATSTENATESKPKIQSPSAPSRDDAMVDKPGVQAQSVDVYAVADKPRNKPQLTTKGDVYAVVDKTIKQANGSTPGKASAGDSRTYHDDSSVPAANANQSGNAVKSSQAAPTDSDSRVFSTGIDNVSYITNDIYAQVDKSAKKMVSPSHNTSAKPEGDGLARGQKPKMSKKPK